MLGNNLKKEFNSLFRLLDQTSFRKDDKLFAEDLLNHDEPGVAIEGIIDQLHTCNVKITTVIFTTIENICRKMKMKEATYNSLKELIQ